MRKENSGNSNIIILAFILLRVASGIKTFDYYPMIFNVTFNFRDLCHLRLYNIRIRYIVSQLIFKRITT